MTECVCRKCVLLNVFVCVYFKPTILGPFYGSLVINPQTVTLTHSPSHTQKQLHTQKLNCRLTHSYAHTLSLSLKRTHAYTIFIGLPRPDPPQELA